MKTDQLSVAPEPVFEPLTPAGWLRAAVRGVGLGTLVFGGLGVLLVLRLPERVMFGLRRPITPFITQAVCRGAFPIMGISYRSKGAPMPHHGIVVANHASWLDIFALNARKRIYFVSKAEVAGWPGIGWLARATGTVFIRRDRREAARQQTILHDRLATGHKLVLFPEGTSSDGTYVLPFKSTLFEAILKSGEDADIRVQPVTLVYSSPAAEDARFYGWWGEMPFAPHLLRVLAAPRQGTVEVIYHAPLEAKSFNNRKVMAAELEAIVRTGLTANRPTE